MDKIESNKFQRLGLSFYDLGLAKLSIERLNFYEDKIVNYIFVNNNIDDLLMYF